MRVRLAIFLLFCFGASSYGQQIPDNKGAGQNERSDTRFSNLIPNSAVLITVGGSEDSEVDRGTGFLLLRRDDEGAQYKEGEEKQEKPCRGSSDTGDTEKNTVPCRILLVTNRHVLPVPAVGNKTPVFVKVNSFSETSKQVREIEIQLFDQVGRYLPSVKFHPHGYDIAVVDVTADLEKNRLTNYSILRTSILAVHSNPPRGLRALPATLGDSVYILGYPSGIYDPRNAYPILRSGIIATDPHINFEFTAQLQEKYGFPAAISGFLIDAPIFPGSSGSLVLRKPINYEYPYAPYAVGIISDSIPIEDLALKSVQRMGLAVVYSSDAIIETLALFKEGKA